MTMNVLHGNVRSNLSKGYTKRLRQSGKIPGVLYSANTKPLNLNFGQSELLSVINVVGGHGVVDLKVDGESSKAVIKEIQRHPVQGNIIHLDLQGVKADQEINIKIPITIEGEDFLRRSGCTALFQLNEVAVQCTPDRIPRGITVDMSKYKGGDNITVADLEVDKNILILDNPEQIIASIVHSKGGASVPEESN